MDQRNHKAPGRSLRSAPSLTTPTRFEWTRQPGTGPGLAVLGNLAGATAIELGCGSGHNLAHLVACHGVAGIGIDHDHVKIRRARSLYGHLPSIGFIHADARRYLNSCQPATADLVLSIFGAFTFADPFPLLTATARILRPGGLLAMTLRADDDHDTVVVFGRR